ncbi:MAG: ABC transporter ATP-binding protein [Ignavibacteria bacterium]|jgi:ABC-2 type transport system ATP-binding protein|nr:ABC transporter ATP-binding protein [Ignavibacteria bacterium]MCU7499676.1 ABC transporter ATP-binding protein [Ignavibacteria bacterium]MCU7511996.1 ABC transporter ATP-binding protein [Ignavibacteria bacterium]MCU7521304.1 ABC transporter ATP-binding protein [Ignavibacteria bacterium]MCU7524753.1 ABC transporter ATP-binding protein [Ignavibacteria bacterium]
METTIKIEGLKKSFGDVHAVDGISLEVGKGEMFGLVGPDGAGKTTTIRMLCGLIEPDSGEARILGLDLVKQRKNITKDIGYLSQKFSLYGDLSVDENIEFFADIHGVKGYRERRNELLEFTRLTPFRDRLADKLSGGMKQKLALACTLIHKPKIIFLDEPTTGVDPVSRRDFWKILASLIKEEITIFMSTPYLDEAERCNRVALMNKGKIISFDTPQNVKASLGKDVVEIVCNPSRQAYKAIKGNTHFEVQMFGDRIDVVVDNCDPDCETIKDLLTKESVTITDLRVVPPSLENVFIHLISSAK